MDAKIRVTEIEIVKDSGQEKKRKRVTFSYLN